MLIGPASKSDLYDVWYIYDSAYDELAENPDFGDYLRLKRPSRKNIGKWATGAYEGIKSGNILFFVAKEGGKVLGFCFVGKKDVPDSELSHVGVLGIRIRKEFRNRGLGTKLVKYALERGRSKFDLIEIQVMAINKASKALFKGLGFKTWGVAPGYVKRGKRRINLEHMYLKF